MKAMLLVLAALLASVAAGPVPITERSDSCATTCKPSQKFRYEPGRTYTYDYTIQTETGMEGASEDKALITITGQADIEVISQCDLVLKLKSMDIQESNPSSGIPSSRSDEFRRTLERSPLRFSFQDGEVAELCPQRDEDGWALNIKRGVLSALQNSMDDLQQDQTVKETDVSGRCHARYEVAERGWYTTTIKRSKDLLACTDRHGYSGSLQTSPYHVNSDLQSVPLMKSQHECEQQVSKKSGILEMARCTESHLFRPFSAHNSGALTKVTQTLQYKTDRPGITSRKVWIDSRADMPFDHSYDISDRNEARARAEALLNKLCDVTMNGVKPEVPRLFSQLVSAVRKMDQSDISDVHSMLRRQAICNTNNDRAKKFFLDALPMAGTSETVAQMVELMVGEQVTGVELDLWLTTLAFIPEPTADMLAAVKTLLNSDKLQSQALLPVSAMVNNFCQRDADCSQQPSVRDIVDAVERNIGYTCYVTDANIKTMLLTVKSLGNMGQERSVAVLSRCLTARLPTEIRVEAANAFRRMPCDADKSKLLELLRDTTEDSELRIAAYSQLMTCPSRDLLTNIQVIMEGEAEDSQVGSFMYTHLTNLMETSSPHKQDVRQMVRDLHLKKQFQLNPLKFSRNYEKSLFFKMFNTGVQGESNIIFSPKSSLPRSLSANLTFDLFGHSVNLLELGGRLEGVEYLLETVMGPYSFFSDGDKAQNKDKLDELKGSMYARIFGNELAYNRFQGMKSLTSGKTFNLLDFLIKLSKDHDYSFTQSLQLLDSSLTVPTASGLPLTLSVNATATVDVRATGKMDLRKVQASPRSINVDGELRPSGAVNVDGVMSVDAMVARTGLKVSGSLSSSVALKGRVDLDRGRVLSVQMDMPDDRQDILDIRTQFFILRSNEEKEQKMITDNRKELQLCTGDVVARVTGLELCGELQFANASMQNAGPYFPLTGPTTLSLVLHKRDSHTGYKMLAKRVENKVSSIAQLSFDTPGSSVVRAVSFDMMLDYNNREAEISFASPWKKSTVKGAVVNEAGLKSVTGSLVIDDTDTYSITSEVKVEDKGKVTVYTPILEIRKPGSDPISLTGSAELDLKFRSLSTDMTLSGLTRHPIQMQGAYTNSKTEKSVKGKVSYGKDEYKGQVGVVYDVREDKFAQFEPVLLLSSPRGELITFTGSATYRQNKNLKTEATLDIPGVLAKPVSVRGNIIKKMNRRGPKLSIDVRVKSRSFTTKASGFVSMRNGLQQTRLIIDYSLMRVSDRVTLNGKFSDKSTSAYLKYSLASNLDWKKNPDWNVDVGVDVDHKKRRSSGNVLVKLGKDRKDKSQQIALSGSLDRKIASLSKMDIDFDMAASVPMLDIDAKLTGSHNHSPDKLNSKVTAKYGKDQSAKVEVDLRNKTDDKLKLQGALSFTLNDKTYQVDTVLNERKPDQYEHSVDVKDGEGEVVSITSTYRANKDDSREVSTVIQIRNLNTIKMSGSTSLDPENLRIESQLMHGDDGYGVLVLSKVSRGPRGKWTLEAYNPQRKVAMVARGGVQKGGVQFDMDLAWDKDRDNKARMTVEIEGKHRSQNGITSSNGKLDFTSPFDALPYLSVNLNFDSDRKRYGLDGKASIMDKDTTYSSSLNVLKPVSPREFHLTWNGATPIGGYQRLEASVDHVMDDTSVSCNLKLSKGRKQAAITITAADNGRTNQRDLKADLALKSDLTDPMDVTGSFAHTDDGRKYVTSVAFQQNGDRYAGDLDMSHYRRDWQIQNNGQLKIASPGRDIITRWQHRNTDNDVRSSFTSDWDRKQLQVELTGAGDLRGNLIAGKGSLKIRSPWRMVRNLDFSLDHKMDKHQCKHSGLIMHNDQKLASTNLNYNLGDKSADLDLTLTSPFHHDISGKVSSQFQDYPETAHLELTWSPRHTITADSSIVKADDDGIEGNVRLTSTFTTPSNIVLRGSLNREGQQLVSKASLDYGVRQSYDVEGRVDLDNLALARLTLNTPLDQLRLLDAGYQFSGDSSDFDASADLTVQPVLGKYQATFSWENDDDMTAKARLTTPHADLQYVQLTATSQETGQGRQSRVELDYYPRQIYSMQSLYSLSMPIVFSVHVNTPIRDYDSFSASLRHSLTDSSVLTQGELEYLPNQKIETTLDVDWQRDIKGSLIVKTPFTKFEESKLQVRHEGEPDDFNSHAQLDIARRTMSADVIFKWGYASTGTVSITSPWQNVKASFNHNGYSSNFRSNGFVLYGDQRMEGSVKHVFTDSKLQSSAKLTTPFTQDIDAAVDYVNNNGNIQADASASYGRYLIKLDNRLVITSLDKSMDTTVTYRLNRGTKVVKGSVSKKGAWDDLELSATASSPYTEDMALSVKHQQRLPYRLYNTITGSYGSRYSIASEGKFDYRQPAITSSYDLRYKLDAPVKEISATLSKTGDLDNLTVDLALSTPFQGFERMGTTVTYSGQDSGFTTEGSVEYMTGKKIQHRASLDYDGLRRVQLDASLSSPIENIAVTFNHNYDRYRETCTGSAQIKSTTLGDHQVSYNRNGNLDSMTAGVSLISQGQKTEGSISRVPLTNGYKHAIQVIRPDNKLDLEAEYEYTNEKVQGKATASLSRSSLSVEGQASVSGRQASLEGKMSVMSSSLRKTASIALSKDGYLDAFTADMRGSYDSQEATAHAEFRNQNDELSGTLSLQTPVQRFSNIGASFRHKGDLDRFDSEGKVTYMDGKDIGGKVSFYHYQLRRIEVTGELTTPFQGLRSTKAQYRHEGSRDSFTCTAMLEYGDSQKITADLRASRSPKYDASLTVKTPFDLLPSMVAQASLDSLANSHNLQSSLDLGSGRRFTATGSLDMDSVPMTASAQLTSPYSPFRSLEISGSHRGQMDDFSSSLSFNSEYTDAMRSDISVKYVSPFDASLMAAVKSQVNGLQDVLLEVKNTQSGDTKTSHVTARWAPRQQITADASLVRKDYWYNKELQADLSLTTPFQQLRSSSAHLEYSNANKKYSPKVQVSANGRSLLDVEADYTHGDNPAASLTARKPWPMELTASLITSGSTKEGNLYVNWNRDKLDHNIRLNTKAMHVSNDYQRDLDYSIKATHKSLVLSTGVTLQSTDSKVQSQGHLSWDERDDSKIYYQIDLSDDSQYGRKNLRGTATLGLPMRTLEATGALSTYRQVSSLEGTFAWDAQRDPTKEIGLTAKVTAGDKTHTDLTLRMPGKELRIDSEMAVNDGKTVWDSKTELSYSPDSRKTIILASSLKDVSSAYFSEGKNYSLSLAISQQYTNVDISLQTHLGATGDRYSTAMDIQYLTARRQKKNMVLRGQIDKLRRQIDLQLVSPMKKMEMQGQVRSTSPYIVTLSNTIDDQSTFRSELNVNPSDRSVVLETNYDPYSPDSKLVLKANYVNDSAVRAELFRETPSGKVSDSLVAARLNTSRLLHTRLHWRTGMLADLQMYGRRQTYDLATKTKAVLQDVIEAVGDEVSAKYQAIAEEVSSELRPMVDLLRSELYRLGQQLDEVIQSSKEIESIQKLREQLSTLSELYQRAYISMLTSMYQQLKSVQSYPIRQKYQEVMASILEQAEELIDQGMASVSHIIVQLDDYLLQITTGAKDSWEGIKNHPKVQEMHKRVELLGNDYRWLMSHVGERVQQYRIPEQYTSAIYEARETLTSGLGDVMDNRQVRKAKALANEVYQQGVWAYNYWNVEENMQKHLKSILELAKQLIAEEMEYLTEKLDFLRKSKVTVYDPEHGEVQAEIVLPIPVKDLNELPDLQPYFSQAKDTVVDYLPSKETVQDLYNKYAPTQLWSSNDTTQDDIALQFERYQPETQSIASRRRAVRRSNRGFQSYRL